LASKDTGTPAGAPLTQGTGGATLNVFSKVFTPVVKEEAKQPEEQVAQTAGEDKPSARKLTLLDDGQAPFKVFSRPPAKDSVFSRPGNLAPLPDDAQRTPLRPALGTRAPLRQKMEEEIMEVPSEDEGQDQDYQGVSPHLAMDYEEDIGDAEPAHSTPFGGRFGQFNVMTPITERTLEYTSTGRFFVPDSDISALGERVFGHPDATEVAERLAAEVRGDSAFANERRAASSRDDGVSSPLKGDSELQTATALVEEKTGTLNLSDAVLVGSTFKPPNPCSPSDPEIISTLLSLLPADPEHYHVPRDAQLLDGLQKFARKLMRSSGSSTGRLSSRGQTLPLQLGERHFSVYEKLGEGGFGAVFATKIVEATAGGHDEDEDDDDDGESHRVAIKVVNPSNAWEFCILRKVHVDLPERLRSSVIRPQALYTYIDESFLILDLCMQGSLLDIVNRAGKAGVSQQGACLDELLVMFFTIELLRLLEGLHTTGIIHGDLKIDNCLVRLEDVPSSSSWVAQYDPSGGDGWRNKGIKLIDFGRAIDTRMFPSDQTFIAEWATDARDCVEMREGRPWTYEADYFGLAGIVYCMLYGKYIEASSIVRVTPPPRQQAEGGKGSGGLRYKLATAFKRYWQTDLWTRLFDVLLNPCLVRPDGALPLSDTLALLRAKMEAWLQANCNRSSNTLKGLLKKVELSVIRGD
jgi:checkpoint serine/threonine-protein kinase